MVSRAAQNLTGSTKYTSSKTCKKIRKKRKNTFHMFFQSKSNNDKVFHDF